MRQKLLLLLCFGMFLLAGKAFSQEVSVTGTVKNDQGQIIPSASILLKGSKTGAISNDQGFFTIQAKMGQHLIARAVGYADKEIIVNSSTINFILTPQVGENADVIVTALGISRNRNTLPYAAQQISGDEVSKTGSLNPVSALSGKVAGLQITQENTMGGSTNVILRGVKSLTQSNQALFVIDGVPYDNSNQSMGGYDLGNAASDLNGDDIASVTVLKGAAASALYGSRGSNGVIIITTKKGKKGAGIGVSASFGVTVGSPDNSTLPVYQTQYGEGYDPDFSNNTVPIFNSNGASVPVVETYADAATGPKYNPSLMVYNWDAFMPGDPNYGKATPWQPAKHNRPQDYFVTPVTTSANVEVSESGEKGQFRLAFRHDDNKDFMPNSSLKKNSLSFSSTYNLLKNLSVGANIEYSDNAAINRFLYPYGGTTNIMTDFRQWWPTNVDINQLKNDYYHAFPGQVSNATWNWQTGAYLNNSFNGIGLPAYHDNPYWFAYTNFENDSRTRYFGNVHIDYKIAPYLTATGRVSKDYYNQMVEQRNDVGSQNKPFYTRYNGSHAETNYDLMFNFNKDLSENINLAAVLGGNIREDLDQNISASTNGGLVVPGFFALSNSVNTPSAPAEFYGEKKVYGVYAGATLGYKEMLTLDATIRRDESSTLPINNNSYYYPSVSLNFQFSKLLPNLSWLSHAKAWTNYAEVGGDAPIFSLYNTYNSLTPFQGQTLFSTPRTNNNANLVPERNKSYEVGLEASFLNERIGFSIDYYMAKQINQIMPTSVSTSTGFSTFYVNGGSIQNSGIELSVNLVPIKTRDFKWNMDINWSNNKQKVLSLYNNQPQYAVATYQNSLRLEAVIGKPYQIQGTDYVYYQAKDANGNPIASPENGKRVIDANGYYEIASNKYSNLGSPFPDWRGGVNNSFKYKNFTFSFLVDVSHGGSVYSLDMDYGSGSGLYPRTAGLNDLGNLVRDPLSNDNKSGGLILKGVHEDGTANTIRVDESNIDAGAYTFSSAYGEADKEFVYDASYIKLREVALTYSIPKSVFNKGANFIKGIDISIISTNPWIIHKNEPYADPEQGQASGNASMGFQNGAYPSIRTLGIMAKINF